MESVVELQVHSILCWENSENMVHGTDDTKGKELQNQMSLAPECPLWNVAEHLPTFLWAEIKITLCYLNTQLLGSIETQFKAVLDDWAIQADQKLAFL